MRAVRCFDVFRTSSRKEARCCYLLCAPSQVCVLCFSLESSFTRSSTAVFLCRHPLPPSLTLSLPF